MKFFRILRAHFQSPPPHVRDRIEARRTFMVEDAANERMHSGEAMWDLALWEGEVRA